MLRDGHSKTAFTPADRLEAIGAAEQAPERRRLARELATCIKPPDVGRSDP